MLSVASLLNPVNSEPRADRLPPSPSPSLYTSSSPYGSPQLSSIPPAKKSKMSKDGAVFAKGKAKGDVNFPPFEDLEEEMRREIRKFQVYPLGKIEEYCRHIPYNSEKKSFLEKTGRESFEVFQYIFKVPGDNKDYTVMWDYNIGLVRITPFFKCCKYSKTTPAKMLNMNPGLKEITHSITGGALAAQGYWMPYACAFAVCTTFCHHIAPALIPLFGPSFPSLCVSPDAPEHGRMIINSSIILSATADAEAYRMQHSSSGLISDKSTHSRSPHSSPFPQGHNTQPTQHSLGRRLRLKRAFARGESSFTDTDGSEASSGVEYFHSPATPNSSISLPLSQPRDWRSHNVVSHSANSFISIASSSAHEPTNLYGTACNAPNPILSAIPRSIGIPNINIMTASSDAPSSNNLSKIGNIGTQWRARRRIEELEPHSQSQHVEDDTAYDGEESSASVADEKMSTGTGSDHGGDTAMHAELGDLSVHSTSNVDGSEPGEGCVNGSGASEKKAAWLLMRLSFKDGEAASAGISSGLGKGSHFPRGRFHHQHSASSGFENEGPRVKRRRATSC